MYFMVNFAVHSGYGCPFPLVNAPPRNILCLIQIRSGNHKKSFISQLELQGDFLPFCMIEHCFIQNISLSIVFNDPVFFQMHSDHKENRQKFSIYSLNPALSALTEYFFLPTIYISFSSLILEGVSEGQIENYLCLG